MTDHDHNKSNCDEEDIEYFQVMEYNDLANGERAFIEIDGKEIVIINIAGEVFSILDECTHDGGPLGDGALDGHEVVCPRHGARFDIVSGEALTLPAVEDTETFPIRIVDDFIEIGLKK